MRFEELLEYMVPSSVEDEAANKLMLVVKSGEYDEWLQQDWRMHQGRDPYEKGDDEDSEEFRDYARDWCEERVSEAAANIEDRFQGDRIRLWRVITAPKNWTPEGRHPGIYWSWDENAAEAHWGNGGENFVQWTLVAEVGSSQIDWPTTLLMNAQPAFQEEREVRLLPGTPVTLISATPENEIDEAEEKPKVIKLSGFKPKARDPNSPASKFLDELDGMCSENPLNHRAYVFKNFAVIEVRRDMDFPDNSVELGDIRSMTKGGGAVTMQMLCELADKHRVTINLYAMGYAHVPTKKLVEYYERFGFKVLSPVQLQWMDHDGVDMRRTPN